MPFEPKLDLISPQLKQQIFKEATEIGAFKTAEKYFREVGMSKLALYQRLKKYAANLNTENQILTGKTRGGFTPKGRPEHKLSKDEKEFLDKLSKGAMTVEDMGNFVAVRVFEKMLKYPDDFKFLDFFRVQLLQLKKDEAKNKERLGNELLARLFAGKLPPAKCPNCGHPIMEGEIIPGKLVELESGEDIDESIRSTESL